MIILNILLQAIILFYLYNDSYSLDKFGLGSSAINTLSFSYRYEFKRLISNNLNHEIFSQITSANGVYIDSRKLFIIGQNQIKTVDYSSPTTRTILNIDFYDSSTASSYFLYVPELINGQKSVLFVFCTSSYYLLFYEYNGNNLSNKKSIFYEEFKINESANQCSGSSFIGKNDIGQKLYVSNAYSKYIDDATSKSIFYDIKIFEYNMQTEEVILFYYVGKSFKVELINFSTSHPSNFDSDILNDLGSLLNKEGISLIKCKIINSFINSNQNDIYYDKEIILLCLYFSKDLVNSLDNKPKLSIKLDLFKNSLGSTELSLVSSVTIKNSIFANNEYNNAEYQNYYIYPSLINFKSEKEIYITLKGAKYSEIYSVNINTKTLILSNVQLLENFGFVDYQTDTGLLLSSSNINHISFCTREYMGSFYIVRYNSDNNILSIFTYGDKNKNIYQDTEIQLNVNTNLNIPSTVKRIETASISSVLGGIGVYKGIHDMSDGHVEYGFFEIIMGLIAIIWGVTAIENAAGSCGGISTSTSNNCDNSNPDNPQTLYHYTNERGLDGILGSNQLNPSLGANNPNDARYGDGQYLSDLIPTDWSPSSLARIFIHIPNKYKYTHYIEIIVDGLNVVQGRDHVFVIPNESPLDLAGRIVGYGRVGG